MRRAGFGEIELRNKDAAEHIRALDKNDLSAYLFSSLYIWREDMGLSMLLDEARQLFVVGCGDGPHGACFFPCGAPDAKRQALEELMRDGPLELRYLPEQGKRLLEECFPGRFRFYEDRNSAEYIYSVEEQTRLEGGEFSHIRHKISRAKREGELRLQPITPAELTQVREITLRWNERHAEKQGGYAGDAQAIFSALEHFEALGLEGMLMIRAGRAVGYVFGAPINADTFDLHAAKCADDDGELDCLCKYEFYKTLIGRFRWVNREEDLGLPGLRERKLSLRPASITPMWGAITE